MRDAFLNQVIVKGEQGIADRLVDATQLSELVVGDVLISQDRDENDIFFIISGSVRIEANGRLVATRQAGTHVGEMALIDCKARRSANVVVAETTVVAKVTEPVFAEIAEQCPILWRRIAVELCERLRSRNQMIRRPNEVPHVFICSSSEHIAIAEQLQLKLDHHKSQVKVWTDNVFGPMKQTMEDLEREVASADFAVAVVMPEDVVRSRKKQSAVPRDNVIFELGLFMGQLGRDRTLIVCPRGLDLKMPSDLLGLNPLTFSVPTDLKDAETLSAPLAPVCTSLKNLFDKLGPR
ncbi:cyclic nucleotide-binding domain-containing protein [bacterium]|nr:cyclic nucleotide-binding domain-containing protein [bacterium]